MNVYQLILAYVTGMILVYIVSVRIEAVSESIDDDHSWIFPLSICWPVLVPLSLVVIAIINLDKFTTHWIELLRKPKGR